MNNEQDRVEIKYVLYGQFIPYSTLKTIVDPVLSGNVVNVFIDCYQMMLPIYRFYRIIDPLNITSCIVNMAIHYRNFFKKRNIHSHIFLLYSPTMSPNNSRFCPEYNNKYITRVLNNRDIADIVNNSLGYISTLVSHMPDVYMKIGTVETSVMALDIIDKFDEKGYSPLNFFVTNSQYAFQLPALNEKVILLFKKRNKQGEDVSYNVTKNDALDKFVAETRNQHVKPVDLDQSWVSGFMTISGIPKRDISSIINYRESMKVLKHIKNNFDVVEPVVLYNAIDQLFEGKKKITITDIANRFNCIDIKYQLQLYRTLAESSETMYLKQYINLEELYDINDKYFQDNPMNLDKL